MQNRQLQLSLAEYRPISSYRPRVGDFVIWHGWFTHYYGIVNGIDEGRIRIIKAGLPMLLFSMDQEDMDRNAITTSINKIKSSRSSYAIQQAGIWYV